MLEKNGKHDAVRLRLDGHCIETTTKKRISDLTMETIEDESFDPDSEPGKAIARELEILEHLVSICDFPFMRAEDKWLRGDIRVDVLITSENDSLSLKVLKETAEKK